MGKRIFKGIVIGLIVLLVACYIYVNDYYKADTMAVSSFPHPDNIAVLQEEQYQVYVPKEPLAAMIFYPGGKVEYTAYTALMETLADNGILSILVEMPYNLAVFDIDAADGFIEQYPQIQHWYLAGHSLGGSMAASYLSSHADQYNGLILLASYSTADLSNTDLNVLSIYGSEDQVLNATKYTENLINLPSSYQEFVIIGGNHADFGMYGTQKGDGIATITTEEQIHVTAEKIVQFVKNHIDIE